MADVKISNLPASTTPLAGTEVLPIVQSGTTVKVSVANLTAGRAIGATDATFTGALSVTPTWNSGATTFTGIGMNVTDTASAAGSLLLDLQVGGVSRFSVGKAGAGYTITGTANETRIGLAGRAKTLYTYDAGFGAQPLYTEAPGGFAIATDNGTLALGASSDVILARDAANTLAQRNGANAQTFRVYNTFTDASNYERLNIFFNSNIARIWTEGAGSGSARNLQFVNTATGTEIQLGTSSIFTNGITFSTDNANDIGASGANRPRNLYMASWIRMAVTTVASLPAAATAGAGARMMVSDATLPVFGSAVVGGGAVLVPVYSTGAAWNVG